MKTLKKYKVSLSEKYHNPLECTVFAQDEDQAVVVALNKPEALERFKGLMPPFANAQEYIIPGVS